MKGLRLVLLALACLGSAFAQNSEIRYRADLERMDGSTAEPLLKLAPELSDGASEKLEGSLLYFSRYRVHIPLLLRPGVFVSLDQSALKGEAQADGSRRAEVVFDLDESRNCRDLMAVDAGLRIEKSELCVAVADSSLSFVGGLTGPYQYRKLWGLWAQAGASYVKIAYPDTTTPGATVAASAAAVRAGVGAWWHDFHLDLLLRQFVADLSNHGALSRWMEARLGYGIEFPSVWHITPHLVPLLGLDFYSSSISDPNFQSPYIGSKISPLLGFRVRFVITPKVEAGGEFTTRYKSGFEYFAEGDARYWLSPAIAMGLGYWSSNLKYKFGAYDLSENHGAAEFFLRYHFQ